MTKTVYYIYYSSFLLNPFDMRITIETNSSAVLGSHFWHLQIQPRHLGLDRRSIRAGDAKKLELTQTHK